MDVEQSLILSLIGNSSDQFKNQHKGNQTVEKEKEKEKGFNMEINQSNKTKEKEKEKERNKRSRINRRENTEYSDEDADDQSNQILGTDSVNNDDKEYQYQQIIGAYDAEIAIFALGHFMRNGQNHMYNSADELIQKVLYVVKLFSHEIPTLSGLAVALLTTLARTGMEHTRMAVINAVQNPTVPPIIKDVKEGARTGKIAGLWYSLAKELDTIVKKGC
ncbi:MAG: hypothetical protein EZS28_042917 [Streblomastix strix]|uniref:Uncharacterized protein n=1 Tax=Streblomastix strix TaxID=222440 RepID=A0A5J4TTJ7_9EUKA|nr:MAG: hypothetical protein EZS28_042917 [Streblomastix strix]